MQFSFLMCSERSGSNMITKIMDNHSEFCGPSPIHLFRYLTAHQEYYGDLIIDHNWSQLLADAVALFNTKIGVWHSEITTEKLLKLTPERSLASVLHQIYEIEAVANQKTRLFVKENHLYRFLPFIREHFPDFKVLYMVRDPRDMALSWKRSPILRGCVLRAARVWKADQQAGIEWLAKLENAGNSVLVRYEDLIQNPESELRRVCDMFGVEYEAKMHEFSTNKLTAMNAQRTSAWKNLERRIQRSNFNKFQEGLFPDEVSYIESYCADQMQFFGYERTITSNSSLSELESRLQALELHEKPAYQNVDAEERRLRAENLQVLKRMRSYAH